jgi:hypothetical protein
LPNLEIGDLLLVPGMGAYTSASATFFNGLNPARTVVIEEMKDIEPSYLNLFRGESRRKKKNVAVCHA